MKFFEIWSFKGSRLFEHPVEVVLQLASFLKLQQWFSWPKGAKTCRRHTRIHWFSVTDGRTLAVTLNRAPVFHSDTRSNVWRRIRNSAFLTPNRNMMLISFCMVWSGYGRHLLFLDRFRLNFINNFGICQLTLYLILVIFDMLNTTYLLIFFLNVMQSQNSPIDILIRVILLFKIPRYMILYVIYKMSPYQSKTAATFLFRVTFFWCGAILPSDDASTLSEHWPIAKTKIDDVGIDK